MYKLEKLYYAHAVGGHKSVCVGRLYFIYEREKTFVHEMNDCSTTQYPRLLDNSVLRNVQMVLRKLWLCKVQDRLNI